MTAADFRKTAMVLAGLMLPVAINLFFLQEKHGGVIREAQVKPVASFEATVSAALASNAQNPPAAQPPPVAVDTTADMGEIIRGIQRELNARGYEAGQPDGVAGMVTRAAIMAYEHDYGLPLTALPSQELLSRIVLGSSAPSAQQPGQTGKIAASEAESIATTVAQRLSGLGYTAGKVNGKIDEQTSRAIRQFEADQKLPETGRISGPLVSRLLRMQGQAAAKQPAQKSKTAQK